MNCTCQQCGYTWVSRSGDDPSRCPSCFTTAWNRDKRKAGLPRKPVDPAQTSLLPPEQGAVLADAGQHDPSPATPQPDGEQVHITEVGHMSKEDFLALPQVCSHGKAVGNHCWQCPQGIARTP